MPASGLTSHALQTELTATMPLCYVKGALLEWVFCQYVEERTGITPGRTLLQAGGNAYDITGPITLGRFAGMNIQPYSRVKIARDGATLFLGILKRRHDSGQADQVIWEAWDDRWKLSKIPILGCLVWDPEYNAVKFLTRYIHRVNPEGFRNCIIANVPGYGVAPVFSWQAEAADSQLVHEVQSAALTVDGNLRAWTPRLHLQYLCCLANLARGSVEGSDIPAWRSIAKSTVLRWASDSLNFAPGGDMDHVMPDTTFRGQKILQAIGETLKHSNTYGLRMEYYGDVSQVQFYTKDQAAALKRDLPLQRGGDANDINTVYDFDLDEDSGETAEAVVSLGAPNHVEGSVSYAKSSGDALIPAWAGAGDMSGEDYAARRCLWGAKKTEVHGTYCVYPETINKYDGAWLVADGGGSPPRPLAPVFTSEAIALMRQHFPRWMRAFKLDSEQMYIAGILKGSDLRFSNTAAYPYLKMPRPILKAQLTYVLDSAGHKTKERWPIRVELSNLQAGGAGSKWHDVTAQAGLELKEDNYIYLSGLTDANAGATELLYTGDMKGSPWDITLKGVRLNLAVPTDHRMLGYAEAPGDVTKELAAELEGPIEDVIDNPAAWRLEDRVASQPIASPQYDKGSGAGGIEKYPVTGRLLDQTQDALDHATQRLAFSKRRIQRTSWRLIGIRPEFRAGDFIGKIRCTGAASDSDYELNAPLDIVTYDFMQQCTVCGNTPEHGAFAGVGVHVADLHAGHVAGVAQVSNLRHTGYATPGRPAQTVPYESPQTPPAAGYLPDKPGRESPRFDSPAPSGRPAAPYNPDNPEHGAMDARARDQAAGSAAPGAAGPSPSGQASGAPAAGSVAQDSILRHTGKIESSDRAARADAQRRLAGNEPIDPEERKQLEKRASGPIMGEREGHLNQDVEAYDRKAQIAKDIANPPAMRKRLLDAEREE